MDTASFGNFLRTVFYILFFYYLIRFLWRLFFPVIVRKAVSHVEDQFRSQYEAQGYSRQASPRADGDVSIDTSNAKPSREKKKVGEYIDFEEIK